jgi:hypothetical protein
MSAPSIAEDDNGSTGLGNMPKNDLSKKGIGTAQCWKMTF